jgi:hypothetical protein
MSATQFQRFLKGKMGGSAKYEPIPRKEALHAEDSDSAESSSMFEDKQFLRTNIGISKSDKRRAKMYRQLRSHRRQLVISMVLHLITLVVVAVFLFSGRLHKPEEKSGDYSTNGSEFEQVESQPALKQAPDFGYKLVTFEEDPAFIGNSAEVDENWRKLWPSESNAFDLRQRLAEHRVYF